MDNAYDVREQRNGNLFSLFDVSKRYIDRKAG